MNLSRNLVLISISFALLLGSCQRPASVELAAEVERLRLENQRMKSGSPAADSDAPPAPEVTLESVRRELEVLRKQLDDTRAELEEKSKELETVTSEFEAYRAKYRVSLWKKATGRKLGDFVAIDGKTLKNAAIKNIDDFGILFTHDSGIRRIAFADLPQSLQDEFHYEPEAARKQQERIAFQQQQIQLRRQEEAKRIAELKKEHRESLVAMQDETDRKNEVKEVAALRAKLAIWANEVNDRQRDIRERKRKQSYANYLGRSASHTAAISRIEKEIDERQVWMAQAQARLEVLVPPDSE